MGGEEDVGVRFSVGPSEVKVIVQDRERYPGPRIGDPCKLDSLEAEVFALVKPNVYLECIPTSRVLFVMLF